MSTAPSASESSRAVPAESSWAAPPVHRTAERDAVYGPVRRHPLYGGVRLRPITEGDRDALMRTVDRCSPETRYARFHETLAALPPGWARRMCQPGVGRVVVAAVVEAARHALADDAEVALGAPVDDEIVGLAQVEPDFGSAELAVLVEDAYHRRGIGAVLVRAALAEAADHGIRTVKAHVLPDNDPICRLLTSLGVPVRRGYDDGKLCWTMDISGLARL